MHTHDFTVRVRYYESDSHAQAFFVLGLSSIFALINAIAGLAVYAFITLIVGAILSATFCLAYFELDGDVLRAVGFGFSKEVVLRSIEHVYQSEDGPYGDVHFCTTYGRPTASVEISVRRYGVEAIRPVIEAVKLANPEVDIDAVVEKLLWKSPKRPLWDREGE